MENKKIYVGKAKYHEFSNGNKIAKIWITPDGLQLINENRSQNGSINLVMSEMRNPDRANNTHTLYVDIRRKPNEGGFTTGFEAQQAQHASQASASVSPNVENNKDRFVAQEDLDDGIPF